MTASKRRRPTRPLATTTLLILLSLAILLLSLRPGWAATPTVAAAASVGDVSGGTAANDASDNDAPPPPSPPDANDDSDDDDEDDADADEDDDDEDDEGDDEDDYDDEDDLDSDSGDDFDSGDDDFDSRDDHEEDFFDVEEYERKIEKALKYHAATKAGDVASKSTLEALAQVGVDGSVLVEGGGFDADAAADDDDELWKMEFALEALEREMARIEELKVKTGYDSGDGSGDSGDLDDDGNIILSKIRVPAIRKVLEGIKDEGDRKELYMDIMEEAMTKMDLDDDLWHIYSYWELHAYFSCARVMGGSRPVYDQEKWTDLRKLYREFVVKDKKERPVPKGAPERSYQFSEESFSGPTVPYLTDWKGRGLKAERDISKGELTFKATNNTIVFTHGHTWRKFLFEIHERNGEPYDDEGTCDVLVWSWVQTLEEGGALVIVMDLDNGSLLNEGRDEPGWEMPNVRCGKEGDTICLMEYYATKDIKEGEELLCDYRGFALLDAWHEMGL